MEVKIDTKEKFTIVLPLEPHFNDNMTAELAATCQNYLTNEVKNLILNLRAVGAIDENTAKILVRLQQTFYENNASFVFCSLNPAVKAVFNQAGLSDLLNDTPTESEAWDIIQMEEIERELSGNPE